MKTKADQIKELYDLHKEGVLNKEEFEKKKKEILSEVSTDRNSSESEESRSGIISSITDGVKNFSREQARKRQEYNMRQEELKAEEEARINKILSGQIKPIESNLNLEENEACYFIVPAERKAIVEKVQVYSEVKSKKKGVLGRAVVGGVLLGPLGALGGAVTAGSKGKTITKEKVSSKLTKIDSGQLLFTNKRILFLGSKILSLPYDTVPLVEFPSRKKVIINYPSMEKGEFYEISGSNSNDIEYYFEGITKNLVNKSNNE
jgi:hypothetical protein